MPSIDKRGAAAAPELHTPQTHNRGARHPSPPEPSATMDSLLLQRLHCRSAHLCLAMAILGCYLSLLTATADARPPHPSPPPTPTHPSPPRPSPPPTPPSPHSVPPPPVRPGPPPPPPPSTPPPPPPPPSSQNCTQLEELSEGPYWIEENIAAADVRGNLSYGVPLNLTLKITNASTVSASTGACLPIESVRIDLWQCRYDGLYSDEDDDGTAGEVWLRGYQYTNSTGHVTFYTIFPGWYSGRTVHIHLRIRIYSSDGNSVSYNETTQIYFDDTITDDIFTNVYPYNSRGLTQRDTYNLNDSLFTSTNVITLVGNYSDSDGYSSLVELSLPFSSSMSLLPNGKGIRRGDGSTGGFASIS